MVTAVLKVNSPSHFFRPFWLWKLNDPLFKKIIQHPWQVRIREWIFLLLEFLQSKAPSHYVFEGHASFLLQVWFSCNTD